MATRDLFTCAEARESSEQNHLIRALVDESTSIQLNITSSALNSWKVRQLGVKLTASEWVYET